MPSSASAASGTWSSSFASCNAAAASLEPPPSPPATGIRLSMRASKRCSPSATSANASRAPRTSVSSSNPDTSISPERRTATVSARDRRSSTVTSSCLPSSRSGPTTSARLSFAGAAASIHSLTVEGLHEGDELLRLERLRPDVFETTDRPERGRRLLACGNARERQRIGERLAAMTERAADDPPELLGVSRRWDPHEGDERRVDVRRWPEDRPRHGMEACPAGVEPDKHRDGAVGLCARDGKEAVRDLP